MWTLQTALLCVNFLCQVHLSLGDEPCEVNADVAFIIDTSVSIEDDDFVKQKQFVVDLVKNVFHIGKDKTHVSALTFSNSVVSEFHLNEIHNADEIIKKVKGIGHTHGTATYIDEALSSMRTDLFSKENGARPDVVHIGILLTDGRATRRWAAQEQAKLAREAGISLLAIGIGKVSTTELKNMVTPPGDEHFFHVKSFDELKSTAFQSLVGQTACEVIEETTTTTTIATTTTTTTQATTTTTEVSGDNEGYINEESLKTCQGKEADVVFVIDMSSSIWSENFREQMQFVSEVVDKFDIDSGKTRVGVLAFSDEVKIHFHLDKFTIKSEIMKAISKVTSDGGITNTHLALQALTDEMFTKKHGSRSGVAHICILITDGRSSKPLLTIPQAKTVHASGIYVFAIGVGNMTDHTEMIQMSSKPSDQYTFEVNGYAALPKIKNLLAYKACEVPQGDQPRCVGAIKADIGFGLYGIGGGERPAVADFIESVGGGFNLTNGNIRIGVRETCGDADIDMTAFETSQDFSETLHDAMSTGVSRLLYRLRTSFGRITPRDTTERFAILIVSGEIEDIDEAYVEAMRLKHKSRLIVVGVGKWASSDQLRQLASYKNRFDPDISHVFPVADISELAFIVKKIHVLMCREK